MKGDESEILKCGADKIGIVEVTSNSVFHHKHHHYVSVKLRVEAGSLGLA